MQQSAHDAEVMAAYCVYVVERQEAAAACARATAAAFDKFNTARLAAWDRHVAKTATPERPADPEREALEEFCAGEKWSADDVRRMQTRTAATFGHRPNRILSKAEVSKLYEDLQQTAALAPVHTPCCAHGRPALSYCPDCAAMHARNLTATPD